MCKAPTPLSSTRRSVDTPSNSSAASRSRLMAGSAHKARSERSRAASTEAVASRAASRSSRWASGS
eukprot:3576269-Prymnesium_polylepis.2